MRLISKVLVLTAFSSMSICVHAEGGTCPPGYYPHNTPGVMGCAPIPGYNSEPASHWAARWGAISMNFKNGSVGAVKNMESKSKAQKAALAQCRTNGGGDGCKDALTYYNQCGVIAWGESYAATYSAATIEKASERAVEICSTHTEDCQIYYADCSLPERVR